MSDTVANAESAASERMVERFAITMRDGLVIRGRRFVSAGRDRTPAVCLAGLTRNGRDFDRLAEALSAGPQGRDVITLDMRGRGESDWDPKPANYTVPYELHDVIDALTALELFGVHLIGTSRGGLIAMGLMAAQPTRVAKLVLNDIGPVIETDGLMRIAGYVGKIPDVRDWAEATALVRKAMERDFPNLPDAEWTAVTRQLFNEANGKPVPGYDPDLAKSFLPSDGEIPPLWPHFAATTKVPVMIIRGARSDLLSPQTVDEMAARHPMLTAWEVPDQGHAPLLRDAPTIEAIRAFLDRDIAMPAAQADDDAADA